MIHSFECQNIYKDFPGVRALDNVTFAPIPGTVHGLIGENGAGKSTLLKIMSGYYQPDSGAIFINGQNKRFANPLQALENRISVIPQELQLVPNQTVAENITVGNFGSKNKLFVPWRRLFRDIQEFLDILGIEINAQSKISQLSLGQKQMVEIAKSIYYDAEIIAFDEPTSSLSEFESEILFRLIRKLKSQNKIIIYVSHRMNELFELCDFFTILKDGAHVLTREIGMSREEIILAMTGKKIDSSFRERAIGGIRLEAREISGEKLPKAQNLVLRKGEILGFFGLIGAGRSELARLLCAADRKLGGAIVLDGEMLSLKNTKQAIRKGIMFCTEDRKQDGIIQNRSIWENINISSRRHFSLGKLFINRIREMKNAQKQVHSLTIRTPHLNQNIVNLSGGNQQKVILGRWLSEMDMKVLIVDEPTKGIDVGAKSEIYHILYDLAESGISIIVVSSELPEIIGICDRIYTMRGGEISAEFVRHEFSEEQILEKSFPLQET